MVQLYQESSESVPEKETLGQQGLSPEQGLVTKPSQQSYSFRVNRYDLDPESAINFRNVDFDALSFQ